MTMVILCANQKQKYEVWNEKGPAPVLVGQVREPPYIA